MHHALCNEHHPNNCNWPALPLSNQTDQEQSKVEKPHHQNRHPHIIQLEKIEICRFALKMHSDYML